MLLPTVVTLAPSSLASAPSTEEMAIRLPSGHSTESSQNGKKTLLKSNNGGSGVNRDGGNRDNGGGNRDSGSGSGNCDSGGGNRDSGGGNHDSGNRGGGGSRDSGGGGNRDSAGGKKRADSRPRKPINLVVGKKVVDGLVSFRGADLTTEVYVGNVANNTSIDDVRQSISDMGVDVIEIESVGKRRHFQSFRLRIKKVHLQILKDPNVVPDGIVIRRFFHGKQQQQHSTTSPDGNAVVDGN